jgi:LuxR family maltose regulon positive regulatory protein
MTLLSCRENDIANLATLGKSDKEIARVLGISLETVKSHKKRLFKKLRISKRGQIAGALMDAKGKDSVANR